jgi:hypothetical protein
MATQLAHVVIDARNPKGLAQFWADALGWQLIIDEPDEVGIQGGTDDINLIFVRGVPSRGGRVSLLRRFMRELRPTIAGLWEICPPLDVYFSLASETQAPLEATRRHRRALPRRRPGC